MKGLSGLLLSLGLGLAAAVCNWLYMNRLAGAEAKESFIGIKTPINIGETILDAHLVKIDLPRSAMGNLDQVAPKWGLKSTVTGQTTSRSYRGGELVPLQDLRTPGAKDLNQKLGRDEVALWIPIDSRTFNSMRVNPDDEISFLLPRSGVSSYSPTPVPNPSKDAMSNEIVGTFRILELGNRTGRPEVQRAAGMRQSNENVIAIVAKFAEGRLDAKAERVIDYMRLSKSQGLQVILHPPKKAG